MYDEIYGESTIIRETNGVPHINSTSERLAIFTLGYVHAQDRLWQMDGLRRLSQGRLSEIFGNNTLELDIIMRNYGFEKHSRNQLNQLTNTSLEYLTYYTYGINEFAKLNTLPLEYHVLGLEFKPWSIVDSLSITKLLMFHATYDWSIELLREYLYDHVKNTDIVDQVLPFQDKDLSYFIGKLVHCRFCAIFSYLCE